MLVGGALTIAAIAVLAPRLRAGGERALLGQASDPHGPLAGLTAAALNRATGAVNRAALAAAAPRRGAHLLDVGFGGGGLIERALDDWPGVHVAGADPSHEMVARIAARRAADMADGRLRLARAGVDALPWPAASFDCVTAVFTMYFWPDPQAGLRHVARLLAPGGRLVVAVAPVAVQTRIGYGRAGFHVLPGPRVAELAELAGLSDVVLARGPHGVALVTARAGPAGHPSP